MSTHNSKLIQEAARRWAEYIHVFDDGRWFHRRVNSDNNWPVKAL